VDFKIEPLAHQAEHRRLFRLEPGELVAQLGLNLAIDVFKKLSIEIGIQHFRMNIAFSADGRRITEPGRDPLDRYLDILLGVRLGVEALEFREGHRRQYSPCPCTEIFCGDIHASNLAKIVVDIRGRYRPTLAVRVDILEQVLPRQLLTGFDDPCYPPVLYLQAPRLAALALEVETQFATCHRNVTAAQRCQAVTAIIFRIILIADPDQRRLEQIDPSRAPFRAAVHAWPCRY